MPSRAACQRRRRISRTCGADWRNPPFIEGQVGRRRPTGCPPKTPEWVSREGGGIRIDHRGVLAPLSEEWGLRWGRGLPLFQ